MTRRTVSIKTKFILTLVLLPLVSILIVGAIALYQNQKSLANQEERNLQRLILEKTNGYDHIFQRIQQEVQVTARYAEMIFSQELPTRELQRRMLLPWTGQGYGNDALRVQLREDILRLQRVGQVLEAMVSNNPYLTLGYMATESAITVFDNQEVVDIIEAIEGFDPRRRPWYLKAREQRGSIWTDLYVDANTKKLTVTAATAVYDAAGNLLGVVGFDVLLETLQKDIINIDIGYSNDPFMISGTGQVIVRRGMDEENTAWDKTYRTDNLLQTPNAAFNTVIAKMVAGQAGIDRFATDGRGDNYLAYAPIHAVGSSLGIIVPRGEIIRPVQESGKLVIIVLAIFVIAAVGAGLMIGNQVTRPIEELTVLVDKASKGLVEVDEIPIKRMDEVGVLAGSFNRMLANLGTVLRELEQREQPTR